MTATSGAGRQTARSARTISVFVTCLGLVVAVSTSVLASIDAAGLVDEDIERARFVAGLAGGLLTALGTKGVLAGWTGLSGLWQVVVAVLVGLVTIAPALWLFFDNPSQEYLEGEITADSPFAKRTLLTGGNGSRYFVTLDTAPGLTATFSIRGAGQEITGVEGNGRIVADGVLAGDATWTVVIKSLEGTGKFYLYVDSVEPDEVRVGDGPETHSFDPLRSRAGFVFDVRGDSDDTAPVYVRARAVTDGESDPGWTLRSSKGLTIDHRVVEDKGNPATVDQSTFAEVPSGEYVLDVFGAVGQRFELIVDDHVPTDVDPPDSSGQPQPIPPPSPVDPGPGPTPTRQPDTDLVVLPAEVQFTAPESTVVPALAGAGFVVQAVPVCSNSFAAEGLAVGSTRQIVLAGAVTFSDEVEIVGSHGRNRETLPRATGLQVKTFNGLPCK